MQTQGVTHTHQSIFFTPGVGENYPSMLPLHTQRYLRSDFLVRGLMWMISSIWRNVKTKFKRERITSIPGHDRRTETEMELYTSDVVPAFGNHWVSKKQTKISLAQFRSSYVPIDNVTVGSKCIDVEKKKIGKVRVRLLLCLVILSFIVFGFSCSFS